MTAAEEGTGEGEGKGEEEEKKQGKTLYCLILQPHFICPWKST